MIRNQQHDVSVDGQSAQMDEGAVIAAITTALFEMTEDTHDLTTQKVTRHNSPWSSKIYGLRQLLRK